MTRYDRQILLPEIGKEGQEKLAKTCVLLVGVGGLGSPIATYLTAVGIGTLGLMDDDTVSITNLHRQVLYDATQVGQQKVGCASRRLKALNKDVKLITYPFRLAKNNASDIISDYDIVVDGTDNFATRYLISDTCETLGKRFVYGSIHGLEGQVAVLCAGNATYRTLFPDEAATLRMPHPGKEVVGVTPAVVGSVEASQVLQLVCGYGEPLIDRLWTIDLRTMKSFIINL
ncbi:MAG: HesA/MoeB/ThiF family protein [Prevotella sp.]|nr:HesA/MoeB/ThiF family protein [Prevotella sp.]